MICFPFYTYDLEFYLHELVLSFYSYCDLKILKFKTICFQLTVETQTFICSITATKLSCQIETTNL